jgi:mRNA interferase MazF
MAVISKITAKDQTTVPRQVRAALQSKAAGLPVPSMVRFKMFTLDHRLARGKFGSDPPARSG